ncbi:hypothetical protein XELAEV_18025902mg [Xenopus laevis]|uniref:Uncharacterized protein n=1 Tax=Xenopus laevis TaxID=8355 RepID=A0A974D1P0_XENLA|nr:hypothetical protein XELAEV_18025902mg [Xenopus laevis]
MEDYEAQQFRIGQVLSTLLSRMPPASLVAGNSPTAPVPQAAVSSAGEPLRYTVPDPIRVSTLAVLQ